MDPGITQEPRKAFCHRNMMEAIVAGEPKCWKHIVEKLSYIGDFVVCGYGRPLILDEVADCSKCVHKLKCVVDMNLDLRFKPIG